MNSSIDGFILNSVRRRKRNKGKTKTVDDVLIRGVEVVTIRRTAVARVVVPATATYNTARARIRSCRVCHSSSRIDTMPVLAPFKYVAVHVIQAPGVRSFNSYSMSFTIALTPILPIPVYCVEV